MLVEVFVDYSLGGRGSQFRTRVKASVRRQLQIGDTIVVRGDGVAPAQARVITVADDNPEVELQLIGA